MIASLVRSIPGWNAPIRMCSYIIREFCRQYLPMFIPTLLCNNVPLIDGGETETRSLWRRIVIFPFVTEFVDHEPQTAFQKPIDTGLMDCIKTWGPEMMLLFTGGFKIEIPPSVVSRVTEQKEENNPFSRFMREKGVAKPGNVVHVHKVKEMSWLETEGLSRKTSTNAVTNLLIVAGCSVSTKTCNLPTCCTGNQRHLNDYEFFNE
jgi:hypothetical protein